MVVICSIWCATLALFWFCLVWFSVVPPSLALHAIVGILVERHICFRHNADCPHGLFAVNYVISKRSSIPFVNPVRHIFCWGGGVDCYQFVHKSSREKKMERGSFNNESVSSWKNRRGDLDQGMCRSRDRVSGGSRTNLAYHRKCCTCRMGCEEVAEEMESFRQCMC